MRDVWTVFWRDWVVLKRRLAKFILSRMVAPLLYLVAFGWGLGRSIQVGDGSYLDFLVPGILALNSMNISFNSLTPVHAERVYHRSLEEYLIAPISPSSFLWGKVLAAVLRGLISSGIILLLAYLFGAKVAVTLPMVLVLTLNCVIFAQLGFWAAMTINTYEEIAQVNVYFLLPMSFLCGTFFSVQTLPEAVRIFVEILPLTHTGILLRSLAAGGGIVYSSLAVLIGYGILGYLMGSRAFHKIRE
ncbi:MAG: ABC transporter permease [Selenomonadaceae bacterium]|nr:ABC transporter permease [Selenomonadaceae bacterium]